MARPERKANGITQQQTAQAEPEHAPEQSQQDDGAAEAPLTSVADASATEAPPDPPGVVLGGPDDFSNHASPRLLEEQAQDLEEQARLSASLAAVNDRIARRGHVLATRAMGKSIGKRNPVIHIAGRSWVPKARPAKNGGGMMLVELGVRAAVDLD